MSAPSVLVTGAGRGIGRAIALAFAGRAKLVAVAGRRLDPLIEVAGELERRGTPALPLALDVTDKGSVESAFAAYRARSDRIGVLVNNAGISGGGPIYHSDVERWRAIVDTNLVGMYLVSRSAVELMDAGGRIINISSVLGRFGVTGYTAYCASKHGVIGFTRALALELAVRKITVNAVCPGWIETEMARAGMERGAAAEGISYEQFRTKALSTVPLGRMIAPEEVADLVMFLASAEASAITGQTYNICGGQTMD